jgi:hypothetical protein
MHVRSRKDRTAATDLSQLTKSIGEGTDSEGSQGSMAVKEVRGKRAQCFIACRA